MSENRAIDQSTETRNWSSQRGLYILTKRGFDLVLSLFLLLVMAPLLGVVAILIKLDSPGPVLVRRRVIGRWGRPFDMYKFRTMYVSPTADVLKQVADGIYKLEYDPRLTRIGRSLRRLSLDEVPQLLNVLTADMSLVGPRPALPFEVTLFDEEARDRLELQPGITGLWQFHSNSGTLSEIKRLDLDYFKRASIILDLRILIATIPEALRGRGSY